MNVSFKEIFNTPEEFIISKGEVLSKFIWNKKNYYLVFKQDNPYSQANILFVEEKDVLEVLEKSILSWEYVEELTSKYIYNGLLHFELKLKNIWAPKWMIENPDFFAYSLDDLGRAFELLYKFAPEIFKNKKDLDIWNSN
ncbi:MAG: hypothetical protein E7162_01470 [Firmicutes bacterium]|nr:hypothetical protein [Bacillota bacterium]